MKDALRIINNLLTIVASGSFTVRGANLGEVAGAIEEAKAFLASPPSEVGPVEAEEENNGE